MSRVFLILCQHLVIECQKGVREFKHCFFFLINSSFNTVVSFHTSSTDGTQSSLKSLQARRGRLIKPKPNLGRSSRLQQPQPLQRATQAETGLTTFFFPNESFPT